MLATRTFPFNRNPTSVKSNDSKEYGELKKPVEAFSKSTETIPIHITEPVRIPARNKRSVPRSDPSDGRRRNDARRHSEKLSNSTRELLADTSIPPPKFSKNSSKRRNSGQRLTVDAVLEHTRVTEKEYGTAIGNS